MNKDEEIGNCNADPDQPNNIHINFFNTGYKKGKLDAEKEADSRLEEERLKAQIEEVAKLKHFDIESNYSDSSTTYYWKQREAELEAQLQGLGGDTNVHTN